MPQVDLNDVALFVRVVDRGGFAKAAREERVPTSTVSRAVSRLEASVGAQLLVRSTRNVLPTAEGRAFYAQVSPAILAVQHAARGVDGADKKPRGKLRVTAPNDIGATFLANVVAGFTSRYPDEWGKPLDFDGPEAEPVRDFVTANAAMWISEFHCDCLLYTSRCV